MVPYYVLVFLPMLIFLAENDGIIRVGQQRPQQYIGKAISVFGAFFIMLLSLRGEACGSDTVQYANHFYQVRLLGWKDTLRLRNTEYGYWLLIKLISSLTSNYQICLAVTSILSAYPIMRFYKQEAERPILTTILFLTIAPFNMYFSGIHQAIAMGFTFLVWRLAKEKKLLKFVLVVWLAMQFHRSAFILLVLYPLYHLKITRNWLWIMIPAILFVYVFNRQIFAFAVQFLWEDYGSVQETGATTVLLLLILFAVYAFVIPDPLKMDKDLIGYRNVLLFAIAIQCFAPIHTLAMRMNYYFLLFVPILIPKIANRSKQKYRNVANLSVMVMMLFFTAYFFLRAHTGADPLMIYPYIPFWRN